MYVSINSKGYGRIFQAVMRDRNLPLLAKSIYSYFCAYAGNKTFAFPIRDKITRDLQISKDTYTKYLKILVESGYIVKERSFHGNVYTITSAVASYAEAPEGGNDTGDNILVFKNIKLRGFGTVPKLVMLDLRLTAQAKAIYSYFASFAGKGTTAFPRCSTILRELGINKKAYYHHFSLLIETGYISAEKQRCKGKFEVSIYHMPDCIEVCDSTSAPELEAAAAETAKQPVSEKSPHTEPELPAQYSDPATSDKGMSDKTVYAFLGHANINNSNIINIYKKNKTKNHRARADGYTRFYSIEQIKILIDYISLQKEITSWCELQQMLGNLSDYNKRNQFLNISQILLSALIRQIDKRLNSTDCIERSKMLEAIEQDALLDLFLDMLGRWKGIRHAERYVAAAVTNLLSSDRSLTA